MLFKFNNYCILLLQLIVQYKVVNGPTSSGSNPARIRKYKSEPENELKALITPDKKKVKLGLKNLAM